MFIIISGFSDLFKVKPKGKICCVHLKLKCLPKTANGSAICLEALKWKQCGKRQIYKMDKNDRAQLEMSEIMSKVQLSWTDKLSLNQNLIDKLGV